MKRIALSFFFVNISMISLGQTNAKSVLWEVSKPGIKYKSYLLGTFHEVNPAFFLSIPYANEKLKQSQILYVERTTADAQGNDRTTLKKPWTESEWSKLLDLGQESVFKSFAKKSEDSSWYKASPLMLLLSLNRLYSQNFCDTTYRDSYELMDTYIEKVALENKIKTSSLDGNQFEIIENASNDTGSGRDLVYAEGCIDLMNKMLHDDTDGCDFIKSYKNFDLNYQFDTTLKNINLPSSLLPDRNNKWVLMLDQSFKSNNCFVAVGIRHLFYKEGLIQQLRERGYTVKPLIKG